IFASSSLLSDASIRVGDYLEIEGGPWGSVDHVGWRATRIRSFENNMIMIPNSKLAGSTFTNYTRLNEQADARLIVRIGLQEDFQRAEDVILDELTQLRDEFEASVKDYEPLLLFLEFGESNAEILVKLRAVTWIDSFTLKHLMIKRI